ncbi:glycosyltransferase family 2 protein [Acinetobacter baumannii]
MSIKLSIVIPSYNRVNRICDTLRSIPLMENVEVIIVNDASTMSYEDVLVQYDYLSIRLINNEKNSGPGISRNIGVKHATGDYVCFIDDDDEFTEDYFNEIFRILKLNQYDLIWTGVKVRNIYNEVETEIKFDENKINCQSYKKLKLLTIGIGFGVVIRKSLFLKVNGFNENIRFIEDTDFFIKAIKNDFRLGFVSDSLIIVNKHEGERMTNNKNNDKRTKELIQVINYNYEFIQSDKEIMDLLESHLNFLIDNEPVEGLLVYPGY